MNINSDYPHYGERIICRKNNWGRSVNNIPLVNGLTGSVMVPPDIGRFNKDTMFIDFLPDLFNIPFTGVEINYKYLNANHSEKEAIKNSPYTKGELFEYAYASTVHLAQGSEYLNGVYIEEMLRPDMATALNYTAVTRFRNKMIYVKRKPKYWNINIS